METKLARLRKERKLTQNQLAEKAGIHPMLISKMERGIKSPTKLQLSTALALADALQVDPHQLLDE